MRSPALILGALLASVKPFSVGAPRAILGQHTRRRVHLCATSRARTPPNRGIASVPDPIVTKFLISKAKLSELAAYDRALLFMLGHIANELISLTRIALFANNYRYPDSVKGNTHTSQALFIHKLLAGKLKEAWRFIRMAVLESPQGRVYAGDEATEEARVAIRELNRHFGRGTLLDDLRDDFVFHYLRDEWAQRIEASFARMPDAEAEFYASKTRLNTHWHASEVIVNYTMLEGIRAGDPQAAMEQLLDEITPVFSWLTTFCDHTIFSIIRRKFGEDGDSFSSHEDLRISGAPTIDEVLLPVFVRTERD